MFNPQCVVLTDKFSDAVIKFDGQNDTSSRSYGETESYFKPLAKGTMLQQHISPKKLN